MSGLKLAFYGLVFSFAIIQFFRPSINTVQKSSDLMMPVSINVPKKVGVLLQSACYDCHSDHSKYPWYINLQPIGWIVANHIDNGKDDLNFSSFDEYTERRKINKLRSIAKQVRDDGMPLLSYKIMHTDARLSKTDREQIINWALKTADSLSQKKQIKKPF